MPGPSNGSLSVKGSPQRSVQIDSGLRDEKLDAVEGFGRRMSVLK